MFNIRQPVLRTFATLPLLAAFINLLYAREIFLLFGPADRDREAPGLH